MYVGSYSMIQKAYDIRTLEETIKINNETIAKGINTGYQIICIGKSYEEVAEYLDKFQEKFDRP